MQGGTSGSDVFNSTSTSKKRQNVKEGTAASDGSVYSGSEHISEISDDDDDDGVDDDFTMNIDSNRQKAKAKAEAQREDDTVDCGLCGQCHGPGQCLMMDRSENLAEYREMLILHADDEPWEERVC